MDSLIVQKKDDIVMRLIHYFITYENYSPIVVRGVNNEVWLENDSGPYRIIRINSNYIHNEEQFNFDIFRTKSIVRQIKKKTLSFNMNTLNIFLDVNEDLKIENVKNIDSIAISEIEDIKTQDIIKTFPKIKDKLKMDEEGLELIVNITNDINEKTEKNNKVYENTFKPKKIVFTYVLMAICSIVFIGTLLFGGSLLNIDGNILYLFGANNQEAVKSGEIYRLLTNVFLHASLMHLAINMYSLYILGNQLENYIGRVKFIIVYLISGLSGSLLSCIFLTKQMSISVGASGAIFGLLGSLLYFGYHYRLYLGSVLKSQIIPLIVLNLFIGFTFSGIDNAAHIGGLIGGYLSTMALGIEGKSSKSEIINGIIVLLIYIGFLSYILFR